MDIPCLLLLKKEEMVVTTVAGEEAHPLTIIVVTWGLGRDRDQEVMVIDQMMTTVAEALRQALTSSLIPTFHQVHSIHSRDRQAVVGIRMVEAEVVSVGEVIEAEGDEELSTTTTTDDCHIFRLIFFLLPLSFV